MRRRDYSDGRYSPKPKYSSGPARRTVDRRMVIRFVVLAVVGWCGVVALRATRISQPPRHPFDSTIAPPSYQVPTGTINPDSPHPSFREALLSENRYLTSGHAHGNSNQILSVLKLIYLSTLLDRIPILSSLSGAAHHEGDPIALSTFYNLTRLSDALDHPILEWAQVKDPAAGPAEPLGCWRTVPRGGGGKPALTQSGLAPAYWSLPPEIERPTYSQLVTLADDPELGVRSVARERHTLDLAGENVPGAEPEEHLLCFDQHLRTWEEARVDGSKIDKEALQDLDPLGPAWAEVGQHLQWNDHLAGLAANLRTDLLGSASQPYIAVHLRQGDFINQRRTQAGLIEPFVAAVAEIRARLVAQHGKRWAAVPVVFATDSHEQDYLVRLRALGWLHLDHARWETKERLGGWYPAHLDLAVLSGASGFVGSRLSSFSSLTARRVESWQGGPTMDVFAPNKPSTRHTE